MRRLFRSWAAAVVLTVAQSPSSPQQLFQEALDPAAMLCSFLKDWGVVDSIHTPDVASTLSSYGGFASAALLGPENHRGNYAILPHHFGAS